jgi:hypothetical protein
MSALIVTVRRGSRGDIVGPVTWHGFAAGIAGLD